MISFKNFKISNKYILDFQQFSDFSDSFFWKAQNVLSLLMTTMIQLIVFQLPATQTALGSQ